MARSSGSSLYSPTAALRRHAINRGVIGGNRIWTVVGIVLFGARLLRRILGRNEVVVARQRLKPGERITIEGLAPRSGRRRRSGSRLS